LAFFSTNPFLLVFVFGSVGAPAALLLPEDRDSSDLPDLPDEAEQPSVRPAVVSVGSSCPNPKDGGFFYLARPTENEWDTSLASPGDSTGATAGRVRFGEGMVGGGDAGAASRFFLGTVSPCQVAL